MKKRELEVPPIWIYNDIMIIKTVKKVLLKEIDRKYEPNERLFWEAQADNFLELCETELTRLNDLLKFHENDPGHLTKWLTEDIQSLNSRTEWLMKFRAFLEKKL